MLKKALVPIILAALFNIIICPISFAEEVILELGTRVPLKLADKVSSGFNNEGDIVNFVVASDVTLGDTVLIKQGARATGIISELIPRGNIGKAGKLTIDMDYVRAVDGKKVPILLTVNRKGEEKMLMSVILAIVAIPPFSLGFLLLKGTDAQLPAGYKIQAKVEKDIAITVNDAFEPVSDKKR